MKDGINNHKVFKILLIVVIIGALFLMKKDNQDKLMETIKDFSIQEKSLVSINDLAIEGIKDIYIYGDTIIKWNDSKLSFLKKDGEQFWEKNFNFNDPCIIFEEDTIFVSDKATGDIYFMDIKGETKARVQLEREIFNLEVSYEGLIAHIKELDSESIIILDKKGDIIRSDNNNDNILTYATNKDQSKYLLSTLSIKGENLGSELSVYSRDGEKLNSLDIDDEIIIFTEFLKDDLIFLTDKNLYLSQNGKIQWRKQLKSVKDIYINGDSIYLLYGDTLEQITYDGRTKENLKLKKDYSNIISFGKNIVLYGEREILGLQNFKEVFNYKVDEYILGIYDMKGDLIIHQANKLESFKFKNKN